MKKIFLFAKRANAIILVITISFTSLPAWADLVIIVNKDKGITSISQNELGRIFLGKSTSLSDGSKAVPINQVFSSKSRGQFDSEVLKRSESQIKSYWSKMMFSGEGSPPDELNGDLDVLQRVMNDSDAIGYVDSSALNDAVKVVEIK